MMQLAQPNYLDPYDLTQQQQPQNIDAAGALGITPQGLLPFIQGGGSEGAMEASPLGAPSAAGAMPNPNDPFAGGARPTNPYTGATLGGGVGAEYGGGVGAGAPGGGAPSGGAPAGGAAAGGAGGFPWADFLGGAGGMFGQMLGGRDPYGAARGQMGQIPGMLEKYFGPYLQAGQWALPRLYSQYGALMADPGAKMAQLGKGFQASPGYQFQKEQATQAANQAAAAGGMVGSPQEQQQVAGAITGLSNQDYYNYLNHVMNLYQQGLGGTAGLGQMGFGAAQGMTSDLMRQMELEAQLAAAQQASGQEAGGGIGGFLGSALGAFL